MQITVNGESRQCANGANVATLLAELGLNPTQIAIERNGSIVPKSAYEESVLTAGDAVEIVQFIGGG